MKTKNHFNFSSVCQFSLFVSKSRSPYYSTTQCYLGLVNKMIMGFANSKSELKCCTAMIRFSGEKNKHVYHCIYIHILSKYHLIVTS